MIIYVDDGETVKIYPVKAKVARAVMTLLETDDELVWSSTHEGCGVAIIMSNKGVHFSCPKGYRTRDTPENSNKKS